MTIAKHIDQMMAKSSWIRKMFEEGARLKAVHGAENVFDFSLGNPNLPPPAAFVDHLARLAVQGGHGYMPQAGFPHVRERIADYVAAEQKVALTRDDIIMTCGAAGALNVALKALLDPGDEVVTPAPCFVEYGFYVGNHGGVFKTAATADDFSLDLAALSAAIGPRTKVVLINSPNNPTGQIYTAASLAALSRLLSEKSRAFDRPIYLISDEPYRKIVFDNAVVPSVFACYSESVVLSSYSKDLSIPGERIGYAAVNPAAAHREQLVAAMTLTNRILGFVNAPALMQRVVAELQGVSVDIGAYRRKRDLLCDGLARSGYTFIRPPGTFYLFPKSPIPDDVAFVRSLQEERILVVPGSGFMGPGYFRIAFCVDDDTIINAQPGFARAMETYKH